MNELEKKIGVYFLMHEDQPDGHSFMRMNNELCEKYFDFDKFQPVMILTPKQMGGFLNWISRNCPPGPSHDEFHAWQFAGFMIRTLFGKIE